jgi:uncharacterized repeat protein (TIGR01451 family)
LRAAFGYDGSEPNAGTYTPALNNDGRFVAFGADATNLVPDDTNSAIDIFMRDRGPTGPPPTPTPTPSADIALTKSASPDPVFVGTILTYTLNVSNIGQTGATTVVLSDPLPAGVTFNSATATQGSCGESAATVTCDLGSLGGGAAATVTIYVNADQIGMISNTATASLNESDPNTSNNTATATTTVSRVATHTSISSNPNPSLFGQSVTFDVAVTSGLGTPSGAVQVYSDGSPIGGPLTLVGGAASLSTASLSPGAHSITASYSGDTTYDTSNSSTLTQTVKANTTTTITSDAPDPSFAGQSVPIGYSVTVNPPAAGTPTGLVTITASTGESCSGTVASATCSIIFSTAGGRTLTASYPGDGVFNPSNSAPESHAVNPSDTSIFLTDGRDPSEFGEAVSVSYFVSPAAGGTPTGNVTVTASTGETCMGAAPSGGCLITFNSLGTRTLTASYSGDGNYNPSTSPPESHTVNKAFTSTSIVSDNPDPSFVGQPVTVAYAVTLALRGGGTPTGDVTVTSNTGETCTGAVSAGSCSMIFSSPGARTLTAVYAGDTNFLPSTSAARSHDVRKALVTTSITGDSPDPSVVGQLVTISFSVTALAPAGGTPTGNVVVTAATGESCTGTVAVGSCSITFITASPFGQNLTAVYQGDSNFEPGNPVTTQHSVNKAFTTTSITGDVPDPSVVGEQISVSYSVAVTAPGGGTPPGNVIVTASTGESCTGTVAAGNCAITFGSAGSRTLTATYTQTSSYEQSTSAPETHTVNSAGTTTTITSDTPDPSDIGQGVRIDYSVVVNAPGAGTPTGDVTVTASTGESCTRAVLA